MNGTLPEQNTIPLFYHYYLLRDKRRCETFKMAIEEVVKPGSRVLELGTGTGILSYFAASIGGHVTTVEADVRVCNAAREFLQQNGVGDMVNVICEEATNFQIGGRYDVVICEMMYAGLLHEQQVKVMRHVNGFLGEHCPVRIPERVVLSIEMGFADFSYSGFFAPFARGGERDDFSTLTDVVDYGNVRFGDLPVSDSVLELVELTCTTTGTVNAARLLTHSFLTNGIELAWTDEYCAPLVIPMDDELEVSAGETIEARVEYDFGDHCSLARVVVDGIGTQFKR